MSIGISEIVTVLLLALILLRPSDIQSLFLCFKLLHSFILGLRKLLLLEVNVACDDLVEPQQVATEDYLRKIAALGCSYVGEYNLESVKSYYLEMLKMQSERIDKTFLS